MKYNEEQKEKAKAGLLMNSFKYKKIKKLRDSFPVTVIVENGFYIIESRICEN